MSANKKTALCVAIAATLSACGGGSDDGQATTPTTTPTINKVSGKVADGYIKGARVFWDCNSNQIYDAGEVSVFTKAGGSFEIDSRQNCDLAVYVPETAIDEDTGLTIGRSYTMLTPKGSESFISPLTTMVQARSLELREQGITPEVADERAFTDVKVALNLSNPLGNYISNLSMVDSLKAHNTAKLAATLYQEDASAPISRKAKAVISIIQPISNNILNVNQGLNVLQPMLGNNNWLADISFDDKAILEAALGQTRLAARENTSLSDTQLLILKGVISDEDVRKSALYSHIDWDNVSLDKKKALLQALRAANIEPTSTNLLQQYRSERNADIEKALADFETKMDSSNQFWSRDFNENASFFIDTGLSALNASLYTAKLFANSTPVSKAAESVARKVFKEKFKNFQYRAAKNAKALQYLDPDTLGLLKDSADVLALDNLKDCISGKKSIDALSSQDIIDITTLVIKITSVAFEEVKVLKSTAKGLKVFADVVDGSGNVVVGASASEKIEGVVLLIESGAALAGISEFENTAGLIKTLFEAYNRGKEYADKVDSEVNKVQSAIIADFNRQTRRIFNLYTAHLLNQIVFDHIEFLPAGTCDASSYSVNGQCLPIIRVSSWSPQQATVGQESTFILNGYGFKAGIGYTVEGCSDLKTVSLTENQFKFSCIPTESSDKHLIIKDKPNGTELFNKVVAVSDIILPPLPTGWKRDEWFGVITGPNMSLVDGHISPIIIENGYATIKSTGYYWSTINRVMSKPINGDNMRIEWKFNVSSATGGISCYDNSVFIGSAKNIIEKTAGNHIFVSMYDGCWSGSGMGVNGQNVVDDSVFIRDLHNVHVYALETSSNKLKMYIDGVVVKEMTYTGLVGTLDMANLHVKGSGQFDYIKIVSDGKEVALGDF